MKSKTTKYMFGSVSHGTMREEHLIPRFLDTLDELDPEKAKQMREEWDATNDNDPEAVSDFLNETLWNALDGCAAPYFYFGSHLGDGCDYGFWLSEEVAQDVKDGDGLNVSDLSEVPDDFTGEVLLVNDHGNTSLYTADKGKLTEIWAIV